MTEYMNALITFHRRMGAIYEGAQRNSLSESSIIRKTDNEVTNLLNELYLIRTKTGAAPKRPIIIKSIVF